MYPGVPVSTRKAAGRSLSVPTPGRQMSSDAIVLLKEDHKEIKKAFREFEKAGDDATKRKGDLVKRIIELLTVHTYIENEVM